MSFWVIFHVNGKAYECLPVFYQVMLSLSSEDCLHAAVFFVLLVPDIHTSHDDKRWPKCIQAIHQIQFRCLVV